MPARTVFTNALNIFTSEDMSIFGVLQSSLHESWARYYGSSLESRNRYNVTDCFETFPIPIAISGIEELADAYHAHRKSMMVANKEGLTKTYNRFHDRNDTSKKVAQLRSLHVEIDRAVSAAYGWQDLALGHGFRETRLGTLFTISKFAQEEVLHRLLELNNMQYLEEVEQGLHLRRLPS